MEIAILGRIVASENFPGHVNDTKRLRLMQSQLWVRMIMDKDERLRVFTVALKQCLGTLKPPKSSAQLESSQVRFKNTRS